MEDKVQVVGRSASELVDVGEICRRLGGGGHHYAASASVKDKTLPQVRDFLLLQASLIINADENTVLLAVTMSDYDARGSLPQSVLRGNYVAQSLSQPTGNRRYLLNQQGTEFKSFEQTVNVASNQCWVECANYGDTFALRFDSSTGLPDVPSVEQAHARTIFTLAGHRLLHQQKGVNIIGNKKVLVE